jgi:hypothetical protein
VQEVAKDLDGNTRIRNDIVDLGAYEVQSGSGGQDPAEIIYVNTAADGNADGSSWTDAYQDLQAALAAANSGEEIWVAKGTYYPTTGTDQAISFALKDGVAIYGGFVGGETSRDARDWTTNVTILSGDIGTKGDASDNSYHVVSSSDVVSTTILDGFTITAGNAPEGQGSGGGMSNVKSNPTLTNIIFSDNSAFDYGGGMSNHNSSPILTNGIFTNNSVGEIGGGGGMYNTNSSNPILTNVTFSGNSAVNYGGGMYNKDSTPLIQNSILWGNTANRDSQIYNKNSTPTIRYALIEGSGGSGDNILDTDPLFVNPTEGDYRLQSDSPALDVGNNEYVQEVATDLDGNVRVINGTVDLGAYEQGSMTKIIYVNHAATGKQNGLAWETAYTDLQAALATAKSGNEIWVATGTYTPTSTSDRTISFTLKSDVAIYGGFAGTETIRSERDWRTNETILSGDIGVKDDASDNSYHVVYNSAVNETAILDGFTITGGNADGSSPDNDGGGMYNKNNSDPILKNITFKANAASNYGAG